VIVTLLARLHHAVSTVGHLGVGELGIGLVGVAPVVVAAGPPETQGQDQEQWQ
jgi:hypothetical protein